MDRHTLIDSWILVFGAKQLIGRPDGSYMTGYLDRLDPVYELGVGIDPVNGPDGKPRGIRRTYECRPVAWLLSLRSLNIPVGMLVARCDTLSEDDRVQLAAAVEEAEAKFALAAVRTPKLEIVGSMRDVERKV